MKTKLMLFCLVLIFFLAGFSTLASGLANEGKTYTFQIIHIKAFEDGESWIDPKLSDIKKNLKKMSKYKRFEQWGGRDKPKAKLNTAVSVKKNGFKFTLEPTSESENKVTFKLKVRKDGKKKDAFSSSVSLLKVKHVFVVDLEKRSDYSYLVAFKVQ
ncbi:hypothetical protein ACFL54_01800 [Planctomycetota bacterium]